MAYLLGIKIKELKLLAAPLAPPHGTPVGNHCTKVHEQCHLLILRGLILFSNAKLVIFKIGSLVCLQCVFKLLTTYLKTVKWNSLLSCDVLIVVVVLVDKAVVCSALCSFKENCLLIRKIAKISNPLRLLIVFFKDLNLFFPF